MNTDVTSILRLDGGAGRLVLLFYGLGTSIVALMNLPAMLVPWLGVLALALLWAGLAILARPDQEPFDYAATLAVLCITTVVTAISCWNIDDPVHPGYASWPLGAMTFLLLVLALRGRRGDAWVGFGILALISIGVGMMGARETLLVVNDVVRQSATLLIGTLFALVLRRSSQTITAIQNNQLSRATLAAATAAAARERAVQTERLERDARPALERILSGVPLTEAELRHFALLETTLRDGIRATGFSTERVAEAVRAARERGLRVVLLDDRGSELTEPERVAVEDALLAQLAETTGAGSVTARLSPHDRDELATIVIEEDGEYRRAVVTLEGTDVTHLS